jgi:hypothetical protein
MANEQQQSQNIKNVSANIAATVLGSLDGGEGAFANSSLESNVGSGLLPFPNGTPLFGTGGIGGEEEPATPTQQPTDATATPGTVAPQQQPTDSVAPYAESELSDILADDAKLGSIDINRVPEQAKIYVSKVLKLHNDYENSLRIGNKRAQTVAEKEKTLDQMLPMVQNFMQQQQMQQQYQQYQALEAQKAAEDEKLALLDPAQKELYLKQREIDARNQALEQRMQQFENMQRQDQLSRNKAFVDTQFNEACQKLGLPVSEDTKQVILGNTWAEWQLNDSQGQPRVPLFDVAKRYADHLDSVMKVRLQDQKTVEAIRQQAIQDYVAGKFKNQSITIPSSQSGAAVGVPAEQKRVFQPGERYTTADAAKNIAKEVEDMALKQGWVNPMR